jgi:hypothetical protein
MSEWPEPAYPTAQKDHLHALGVITLNFNNLESVLFRIFSHHMEEDSKIGIELAWQLWTLLQDAKRAPAIRYVYSAREKDPAVVDHIEHGLKYFHCCETNRNHLFHSIYDPLGDDKLHLRKGVRDNWQTMNTLVLSLPELRRCADEMFSGWKYFVEVWFFLKNRDGAESWSGVLRHLFPQLGLSTLPQKPPLPATLNPDQVPRS